MRAGGEGDERGWGGWMASSTQWTWVWVDSGTQWWTGRPGVLRFMGLQRVRHDWVTELSWTELKTFKFTVYHFHLSDDVLKHILNFPFPSPFTNITVFFFISIQVFSKLYKCLPSRKKYNTYKCILDWPKYSFRLFHNILQKMLCAIYMPSLLSQ